MSLQEIIARGTIVSTGSPQYISIPAGFDEFHIRNLTNLNGGAGIVESIWYSGMNNAMAINKTLAGGNITEAVITAAGFSYIDWDINTLGAAVAITNVSQAAPAVVSTGTTPVAGQIVRVYGTTAQLQSSGIDYTVGTVVGGVSFQLAYLDSSGFAAAGTAGFWRLVPHDSNSYPRNRVITGITAAASAVVTFSVTHNYVVGEKLFFRVPSAFGMVEMDGLTGTITAINTTTNTVTVDIDSSAFTAFAFPLSATAASGVSLPNAVPAGENANILTGAYSNPMTRQIFLGTAIDGTSGDVMEYWAIRSQI